MANVNTSKYEEKKQHGTALMPFVIYGTMMPHLYSKFPLHCHEEFEIILADVGVSKYTVAGKEVYVSTGDILVIMPWVLHKFKLTSSDTFFLSNSILGTLSMISNNSVDICSSKYFANMLNGNCTPYCLISCSSGYYYEFRKLLGDMINSYFSCEEFYEFRLKCLVSQFFHKLLKYHLISISDNVGSKDDVESVRRVIDYITQNYKEHITLEDLASAANLSETSLSRIFRSSTGMSCIDYVIEYRLSCAVNLLRDTALPIIDVAYDTGFNNISYFNRTFKKHYGMTPTEFRKNRDKPDAPQQ